MRLVADENVEEPIVTALRKAGHDVTYITEVAPGSSDGEVLDLAGRESRLVLTNDKDFGEMAYREKRLPVGVILLRLDAQDAAQKASVLMRLLPALEGRLPGHFAVVTERRVRLRPMRSL